MNPDLYLHKTYNKFKDNNKKIIGLSTDIDSIIEFTDKSEKPDKLNIGDILFYVDKLIIITKNVNNINTNYIKLGNIANFDELSKIIHELSEDVSCNISFRTLEVDHNSDDYQEEPKDEPSGEETSEEPVE
jgi:hypothetical protein